MVYGSKLLGSSFDDIWQKNSKDSRIEFACFSFHVGAYEFLKSNFHLSTRTPKITRILTLHDAYEANAPTLTRCNVLNTMYTQLAYKTTLSFSVHVKLLYRIVLV